MKGPEAFRTISEAADELGVPQHVLRFWESKFSFIRPMKRAGGRRFYRPQDLEMLKGVRGLLREEGYTIKGVQRLHKEQGLKRLLQGVSEDAADPVAEIGAPELRAANQNPAEPRAESAGEDAAPLLLFASGSPPAISPSGQARLQDALDELQAVKARLNRLIHEA
jgi:DNA-binding transcriptional MerR regulator